MRPDGAKASNRVSVSGGVCGRDVSQEALNNDAADGGDGMSSSTPGIVGKAINKRAGQPESRDAGAPQASKRKRASHFALISLKRWFLVVLAALAVGGTFNKREEFCVMRIIYNSAAAGGVEVALQASLQVALHVTMRQNGAKASNRVSVSGGVCGRDVSQEALNNDAADGGFYRWFREVQHQRLT
jgi:hypothetical protein